MTTFTSSPTSWIRGVDRSTRPLPPPSPSLNSLTTGLWVPVLVHLRVSCTICASGGDSKIQSSENRFVESFGTFSSSHSVNWKGPPDRDHSFSTTCQSGSQSQATRFNETSYLVDIQRPSSSQTPNASAQLLFFYLLRSYDLCPLPLPAS